MNRKSPKLQRQQRTRSKIKGTANRPRLSVFRSNAAIYAQLINDEKGVTLFGISEKDIAKEKGTKQEKAKKLGMELAKKAIAQKINEVIFDKGSYLYHGRVKALAQGAREGGLKF